MSPDARLIAAAILSGAYNPKTAACDVKDLEAELGKLFPDSDRGIRGMVPVAYLKDILQGVIARIEATRIEGPGGAVVDSPLEYAKRRLADVEAL